MIKVFVNYPVCKNNLAPYWKLDELNITVENLYQVIENIEHEILLDESGLCVKVFSQDDAEQLISLTKDRYDRFNHDVKITQDYLKQYASKSALIQMKNLRLKYLQVLLLMLLLYLSIDLR